MAYNLTNDQNDLNNQKNILKQMNETSKGLGSVMTSPMMNNLTSQMSETSRILGSAMTSPAMSNLTSQMSEISRILESAINSLPIENILEIADTVQKMTVSIPNFSEIDWDTIDFTDSDIEKAEEIIKSENIDVALSEEINQDITASQPPKSILFIIMFFSIYLAIIQLNISSENSANQAIFNINIELNNANASSQKETTDLDIKEIVKKHFDKLLYAKEALDLIGYIYKKIKVYLDKSISSQVVGKLDAPLVVKIVETDEEWSYIIHEDSSGKKKLEGWVLTRDIKKLNKRGE